LVATVTNVNELLDVHTFLEAQCVDRSPPAPTRTNHLEHSPAPRELRRALATIDRVIADYADTARLPSVA